MDKILLCSSDIEDLLRWRDKHKELMGRDNRPMRAVEIVITDNGYRIKAIRDGASLKLHLNIGGRSVGRAYFARRLDGMFVAEAGDIRLDKKAIGDNDAKEVARSMLTVYCSLMTLMVYGKDGVEQNEPKKQTTAHKRSNKAHKKPKKWITYILHRKAGEFLVAPRGYHASPSGTFSVRGHFRHYKSGKVVWIAEYNKGTGKKKSKTYKLGGGISDGQE